MKIKGGSPGIKIFVDADLLDLGQIQVKVGRGSTVGVLRNLIIREISELLKDKYPAAARQGEDFMLPGDSEIHFAGDTLDRDRSLASYNINGNENVRMTKMQELLPAIRSALANARYEHHGAMEEGGARRKSRKLRMRKQRRRGYTRRH
jgi:hypothetical protein